MEALRAYGARLAILSPEEEERALGFYRDRGWEPLEEVLVYRRNASPLPAVAGDLTFAPLTDDLLPGLMAVEAAAFPWLWRYGPDFFGEADATPAAAAPPGHRRRNRGRLLYRHAAPRFRPRGPAGGASGAPGTRLRRRDPGQGPGRAFGHGRPRHGAQHPGATTACRSVSTRLSGSAGPAATGSTANGWPSPARSPTGPPGGRRTAQRGWSPSLMNIQTIGILHHPRLPESQRLARALAARARELGAASWQASVRDEQAIGEALHRCDLLVTHGRRRHHPARRPHGRAPRGAGPGREHGAARASWPRSRRTRSWTSLPACWRAVSGSRSA